MPLLHNIYFYPCGDVGNVPWFGSMYEVPVCVVGNKEFVFVYVLLGAAADTKLHHQNFQTPLPAIDCASPDQRMLLFSPSCLHLHDTL